MSSAPVRLTQAIQQDAAKVGYQLDSVILIGGSSRTPCIIRRLHETLQVEPRKWQKQDVAVALGAAYHAQQLWGRKTNPPAPQIRNPIAPRTKPAVPASRIQRFLSLPAIPNQSGNRWNRNGSCAEFWRILLGGIGVHKFVLGNVGAGIVMILISCTGVSSVIALIEGIIYFTKSDAEFIQMYQVEKKAWF